LTVVQIMEWKTLYVGHILEVSYEMQRQGEIIDDLMQSVQRRQAREFMQATNNAVNSGTEAVCKEAGITQEERVRIYNQQPVSAVPGSFQVEIKSLAL
jgi:hypothetical protein